MDAERVQRIKLQAQEALNDLSPSGILGWSAMTACVAAVTLIEDLNEANSVEILPKLRGLAKELAQIETACRIEQHRDALDVALGRVSLVAKVAADALQADAG